MIKEAYEDLEQLDDVLLDCKQRLENADYTETLEPFEEEIAQQQVDLFANECDSSLVGWAQSKPSTTARQSQESILVESGRLKVSLTEIGGPGNVNESNSRGLMFGSNVEYSFFHQLGTSRMPARPPVGLSEQLIDELANTIADSAVQKLKVTA